MELRQLEYAVALADELHFGRAAQRLHIVQSGLSQQLRKLERELGVTLFDRSTHHVSLTSAGEVLVREARQVLAAVTGLAEQVRSRAYAGRHLRLGVADAGISDLSALADALQERFPGVDVREESNSLTTMLRRVRAGELDLAIGLVRGDVDADHTFLRQDPMGVLLGASHELASRESVFLADLRGETVLLGHEDVAPEYNALVEELLRGTGVEVERAYLPTPTNALQRVSRGGGVVLLPPLSMSPPGVVWRQLSDERATHPWSVVWRRGEADPLVLAAVEAVRELVH